MHHLPEGTHCLANRPGALDRWTFQIGPRGRTCTCNLSGLSGTPLHWATRGWCPRPESHRHCARFKCAVSALDYMGEMAAEPKLGERRLVPREGFGFQARHEMDAWIGRSLSRKVVHPQPLRSKRSVSCSWTNAAKNGASGRTPTCKLSVRSGG